MRQRERDDDAVAADPAPALGEVPEQRLQAPVDAGELGDRLRRGEPQRALGQAVEERGGDLRQAREPRRRSGGRARRSVDGESTDHCASTGSRLAVARDLPRAEQVAGAEQLGADVVGDDQLARDHALEHEQPDVVGARAREAGDVPRPDAEPVRAHEQLALGLRAARLAEQARRGRGPPRAGGRFCRGAVQCVRRGLPLLGPAQRSLHYSARPTRPRDGMRRGLTSANPARSTCGGSARRPCRRAPRPAACRPAIAAAGDHAAGRRASRRRPGAPAGWLLETLYSSPAITASDRERDGDEQADRPAPMPWRPPSKRDMRPAT